MNTLKYVSGKEASKILGIHERTLYLWDKAKKIETIRTPGNKRLYNITKFLSDRTPNDNNNININEPDDYNNINEKIKIVYVRVSSNNQKDDLERQKNLMVKLYPKHLIIEDIGSGINFNRRGLRKIIDLSIEGKINKLVVAHKDRLTRFGFELIEDLIKKYSNGTIILDDEKESKKEPKEELVEDVLQILNVYTAKMNGLRKYNKNKKE